MTVASPCVRVCTIDLETGCCIGCGRTREEISGWALLSDSEKLGVLRAIVSRKRGATSGATEAMDCAACALCAGRPA